MHHATYANNPMSLLSLFFTLVYTSPNFIIEHLLRLSRFPGISQITEIKGARASPDDTSTSRFRARTSRSHIARSTAQPSRSDRSGPITNMIGYSQNQSFDDSTKARAEPIRR